MSYRINCADRDCGFAVESSDPEEVIRFTRQHSVRIHGMDMVHDDVQSMIVEMH